MASREIDPRFFLPPGVVELGYSDKTLSSTDSFEDIDAEVAESDSPVAPEDYVFIGDENTLPPPDSITIVSQTVRVHSGGSVVDVVIDVDAEGASQFEVRLTK